MKKKKIIILSVIILIIIGIIVAGIMLTRNSNEKNNETKLNKIYYTLTSSQTYLFKMTQNEKNQTIMAKKNEETVIDQYTEDSHSTTLIKDGDTYLILHDRNEYYVYEGNNVEQNLLTEGINELINKEFTSGTEKVKGKKYDYEEYNCSTIFMISNQLKLDEEVKTKFYFDKNKDLKYIKTTFGNTEELLEIELSNEVNDSLFTIPSDYAEN